MKWFLVLVFGLLWLLVVWTVATFEFAPMFFDDTLNRDQRSR